MSYTNFPNGLTSFGIPVTGYGIPVVHGKYIFVDAAATGTLNKGTKQYPYSTITAAVARAQAGDCIVIMPGDYDESVTISRELNNLVLVCPAGRGAAYIAPTDTDAVALTNNADDVTIVNVGLDGADAGAGLINTGSRLRVYGSKLEGDDIALQLTLGTVAQEAAGTHGVGADILLSDCEIAWATTGGLLTCTDYGAVTQVVLDRCRFHNSSAAALTESVGSGGSASVLFRNLVVQDCTFDDLEDGTAPTAFILLNDDNANTGIVTRCSFPTAINSGDNLVSTAVHWVCNYHTGGVSTGQPS